MADKRADQLKEITERLEQGVKDIFTSEMYTKYLLTMSKFHNYSFNNTLLIAMQRPDATLVAGYNAWKNKFNRYVKKGEKGIQIIAPAPVKEREEREKIDKDTGLTVLNESGEPEIEVVERVIPRFRVTTVFDYAQTDGEPLPTLEVNELTARVKDYTLLKEAIEQVSPVPIRFGEIEGSAKGYYSHMDKEICVRADMGESQTIKTMIHEVAHAMLHDSDQMKQRGEEKDQLTKETEAESIAFTVCSALGIDTSDYSFPYVASWASGKELKELKDSMDTIRLTSADFLEKLETAVAERSVERMTAMEYAEKLIADKEQDKTIFDNSQRNLIVNFAYKLDDRAAMEELANNLAAAIAAENTEEVNRLMWEAEEKIESLPDGMIGLSEMHEYGYLKDDVLPLTKEGAREWHRQGERIYPLFQDGTAGDFASQEEIEQHDGIFGIKADAWSAILLEKNEEYLEDEYVRPDAALTVISREQALRLFDEGKQIYLIRISPWPVLVTGREEIERGSDYFQIAKEDLEKDKQKAMENSEKAPVEKLAADLDDFAFDFDFYHYKDSVEDREQAVEALKEQIQAGDVQPIREWLQDAVEESEGESAEKAAELITRLDALVKEQKLLSGSEKQFGIYQITARDQEHDYRFMNLDFVKRHGMEVNRADYELVYTAPLTEKNTLEAIYERFNIQRPADFTGHSLSVSDVVVLNDGKSIKACYVDSIGFAELPDFFKERKIDLQKETILDEQLQEIEIFDKPGLFSNGRLRDEDVPEGLYRYDLRGSDYNPGQPILVEKTVIVNHAASVLMAEELDLGADGRLELGEEGLNFTGELLTVREFMKEQEEKNNGLLHGDSYNITVEGHIGTWYAIDETEVNGEKFFLLEHEEYGDEAACVAVNEQGKLAAEDLWNGFDEDFQDAVKEYFAEKNPTSQKEEQSVPVAEESRMDNSDVPVYYESFGYAAENGEVDLYRISRQLNEECRNAIEEAIADNFDGMHLADDATKSVVEQFGMERMGYILAYTLNYNNHDGRYSHSNKEWADITCKGERGNNIRTDWIVRSHPAVLNGFVDMYRKELAAEQQREPEKSFAQQFYVVTDLQTNPMQIEKFGNLDDAMSCYQQVPNINLKALGVEKTPDPLPGSLDIVQCKNGIDTIVEDYKKVPGWDNPYIQNHVVALVAEALKVQDVEVAYKIKDGYFYIQISEDGYDYTLYNKDFTVMDGGIVETDEYRPVQEVMEEVLAEHGHSISECGVISAEYLQEQSYRAETQRAEAMKEKLAAEKPAPEASISFYVAECAEFPVMGEFHDNLTLEQALEVYDKIPAERMNGIKSIGFSLEDGSIYSGMFDLVVGGEVQAEIVNHIQHYRESPLVQKAISDMKTLLEKRQASKELEERPNTRQSVREALKNRKKAQEQQSNQEQAKPKKAKKKGEMEL
jgi:antirestriction protein ArdC